MANLAAIELHPSLSLAKNIDCPTMMVFDLDPGPPANIVQCAQVGMWLREIFEHFGLQSFPKTSGSKGLQIYVPLNTPTSYEATKPFAHALARLLEDQHRELVVSDMKKELRKGKVLVDWSQNDEHKTTIAVYSLRAREHPTVSTPVKWEEVEQHAEEERPGLAGVRGRPGAQARGENGRPVRAGSEAEAEVAEAVGCGRGRSARAASEAREALGRPRRIGNRSPGRKPEEDCQNVEARKPRQARRTSKI